MKKRISSKYIHMVQDIQHGPHSPIQLRHMPVRTESPNDIRRQTEDGQHSRAFQCSKVALCASYLLKRLSPMR